MIVSRVKHYISIYNQIFTPTPNSDAQIMLHFNWFLTVYFLSNNILRMKSMIFTEICYNWQSIRWNIFWILFVLRFNGPVNS